MAKKKKVPEQLVLGAKLHCTYCVGDACSYLWVDTKTLDINNVPLASVDDCVPLHNIPSFGLCNMGEGTCDVCMKFDGPWENPEPQGLLASGKEAITMDSILSCSHGTGMPLEIISSGQDHLFVSQIIFMKEMDQKYPGLRKILEDPEGSLYLNDGMYQMALQFLEDRINADGGAVSLYILDDKDNPEAYYIKSALGHLEPAVNVTSLQTYVDGFNAVLGRYDGSVRATIDDHSLNGAMLDLFKRDCAENNRLIQAGGFYKWQEEHKGDLALLANWMRGAVSYSMMAASVISSGPGASVNSVEGEGWSEEVENVKVEGESGTPRSKFNEVFDVADNYKLSDDVYNNHILDRHGPNSSYGNKSHFNSNFDIKGGIGSTLKGDNFLLKPNTAGRDGYIFERTFKDPIGMSNKGKPLYSLKVVIDESGNVVTAFPKN